MNLPYIGQIKQLRNFLLGEKLMSPALLAILSDTELIDKLIADGFSFVVPYNGGYTTADEILLIPNDALSRTAKFFR